MGATIVQAQLLAQGNVVNLLVWSSAVIVVLMLAGVGMLWVRRKYWENRAGRPGEGRFSLASLERMYQEGQLSRDEFRRLRYAVLGVQTKPEEPPADSDSPAADPPAAVEAPDVDEKNPGGELSLPPRDDDGNQ